MKCYFDGVLNSQDAILMNLYKRIYPKISYREYEALPPSSLLSRIPASLVEEPLVKSAMEAKME